MMSLATVFAWIVVVLHVLFGYMESAGWSQMSRRFGYSKEATETTRTLALNQGAYNAGIAAVIAWALVTGNAAAVTALLVFILAMAVVGAVSVRWTIFVIQGVPTLIALALRLL